MCRAALLATTALLLVPGPAAAGVASVDTIVTDAKYGSTEQAMFFVAGPGERNQLTLMRLTDVSADLVLRDPGASVRPGPGCRAFDAHTVVCDAARAYVDAGDGDDTFVVPPVTGGSVEVRGGAGADTLSGARALAGGAGDDVLNASADPCAGACPGRAVLAGGGGDDVLRGGDGDDELSGDAGGPAWPSGHDPGEEPGDAGDGDDTIDGGAGTDTVSYRGRGSAVRVDLATRLATGAGGERDRLAGIENAAGGDGPDLLLGDERGNVLQGGPGDDRIAGRGGDDDLLGNLVPDDNELSPTFTPADHGSDRLRGGGGDDRLDAGGERGDAMFGDAGNDVLANASSYGATRVGTARCGTGTDVVAFEPHGQLLSDCERVDFANEHAQISARPARRPGALRFAATCVRTNPFPEPCEVAVTVRLRGSLVGRASVSIAQGARRAFAVRARRSPRRGDVLDVAVSVRAGGVGPARMARWRARLR